MISKSEIRRLIQHGAVDVEEETPTNPNSMVEVSSVIRIGKKKFVRVIFWKGKVVELVEMAMQFLYE